MTTTATRPDRIEREDRPEPERAPRSRTSRLPATVGSWVAWTAVVLLTLYALESVLLGLTRVLPTLQSPSAPAAGAWTYRAAAAGEVVDDRGVRWPAATSLRGGQEVAVANVPSGTASPQLYATARVGARWWSVPVPAPGRYAVDLLVVQPDPEAPAGSDVFDVLVGEGGSGIPLQRGVDLRTDLALPQHVTGIVDVRSEELVLSFIPVQGEPAVTGLVVTSMGQDAPSTLLDERFDGAAGAPPPDPWSPVTGPGPFGDGEIQGYADDARHVALDGAGALALQAERVRYPEPWTDEGGTQRFQPWTSARLETRGRFTVTYGTVSARMQVPSGQGLWPAFWMLGADVDRNPWPLSGEIDVLEHLGADPATVYASVRALGDEHDDADSSGRRVSRLGASWTAGGPLTTGLHTYSAEITPGYVSFAVDGRVFQTVSQADLRGGQQWPLGKPYYLILNLAVGGTWGGLPDASTPSSARLLVDSVEVVGWP